MAAAQQSEADKKAEKEFEDMFKNLDTDKDGKISLDEFRSFLAQNDIPANNEKDLKEYFDLMDLDHDGKITLEEAKKGVEKIINEIGKAFKDFFK